ERSGGEGFALSFGEGGAEVIEERRDALLQFIAIEARHECFCVRQCCEHVRCCANQTGVGFLPMICVDVCDDAAAGGGNDCPFGGHAFEAVAPRSRRPFVILHLHFSMLVCWGRPSAGKESAEGRDGGEVPSLGL